MSKRIPRVDRGHIPSCCTTTETCRHFRTFFFGDEPGSFAGCRNKCRRWPSWSKHLRMDGSNPNRVWNSIWIDSKFQSCAEGRSRLVRQSEFCSGDIGDWCHRCDDSGDKKREELDNDSLINFQRRRPPHNRHRISRLYGSSVSLVCAILSVLNRFRFFFCCYT